MAVVVKLRRRGGGPLLPCEVAVDEQPAACGCLLPADANGREEKDRSLRGWALSEERGPGPRVANHGERGASLLAWQSLFPAGQESKAVPRRKGKACR